MLKNGNLISLFNASDSHFLNAAFKVDGSITYYITINPHLGIKIKTMYSVNEFALKAHLFMPSIVTSLCFVISQGSWTDQFIFLSILSRPSY